MLEVNRTPMFGIVCFAGSLEPFHDYLAEIWVFAIVFLTKVPTVSSIVR
jgi:hypothetical protein